MKIICISLVITLLSMTAQAGIINSTKCYFSNTDNMIRDLKDQAKELDIKMDEFAIFTNVTTLSNYVKSVKEIANQFNFVISCTKTKETFEAEKESLKSTYLNAETTIFRLDEIANAPTYILIDYISYLRTFASIASKLDLITRFGGIEHTRYE